MCLNNLIPACIVALLIGGCAPEAPPFKVTGQQSVDSPRILNARENYLNSVSTSPKGVLVSLTDTWGQPANNQTRPMQDLVSISMDNDLRTEIATLHLTLPNDLHVVHAFAAKDGGFWGLARGTEDNKLPRPQVLENHHHYLIKLNANGDVVWTKQLPHEWESMSCGVETRDGLLLTGWKALSLIHGTTPQYNRTPAIEKLDRQGNSVWERYLDKDDDGFIDNWATLGGHCKQLVAMEDGTIFFSALLYPWVTFDGYNGLAQYGLGTLVVLKINPAGQIIAEMKSKGHWTQDAYLFGSLDGSITLIEHYMPNLTHGHVTLVTDPMPKQGGIRITKLDADLHSLKSHAYDIAEFTGKPGDVLLTDSGQIATVFCNDGGYPQISFIDPDQKSSYSENLAPAIRPMSQFACMTNGLVQVEKKRFLLFSGNEHIGYRLYSIN